MQARAWGLADRALLLIGNVTECQAARGEAKLLEDAFEAVIGAIFLDGGYAAVQRVLLPWMSTADRDQPPQLSPKTRLQEAAQSGWKQLPVYEIVGREGPPHEPVFHAEVSLMLGKDAEPEVLGRGRGGSIKVAEALAAEQAMDHLVKAGLVQADEVD